MVSAKFLKNTFYQLALAAVALGVLLLLPVARNARADTSIVQVAPPATEGQTVVTDDTVSYQPLSALDTLPTTPQSCRYGVTNVRSQPSVWNGVVRAGYFIDFSVYGASSAATQYVPIIRMHQRDVTDANGNVIGQTYVIRGPSGGLPMLRTQVLANPGRLWIVGNEPDTLVQDGMLPEVYAAGYHAVYTTIKNADPTARVANAGLVSGTPNRIEYLEKVDQAYRRQFGTPWPVDVWTMHIYILPEMGPQGEPHQFWKPALGTSGANGMRESNFNPASCQDPNDNRYCYAEHDSVGIVESQLRNMRNWMASKGQQAKPLMLTEWSVLYPYEIDPGGCYLQDEFGNCFTPQRVTNYLRNTVNLFENATDPAIGYPYDGNRLLQNWLWFATYVEREGRASNLLQTESNTATGNYDNYLTQIGREYVTQATKTQLRANLNVARVFAAASSSDTVKLTAMIVNNGNIPPDKPFKVTFYSDAAMTVPVAETTVTVPIDGCGLNQYYVSANWTPPAGRRLYYVKVDSGNVIGESNENDNSGQGLVFSQAAHTVYLPISRR